MSGQNDHFAPEWFKEVMWQLNLGQLSFIFNVFARNMQVKCELIANVNFERNSVC